ncbi:ECF transporter S component [Bacillus andreraoultii]|uniref:ECF transporter S component n=1 Tax=Bacillus andreraoultii TaxID=1499685 RepID=UPI00053A1322|nr:ECF transporter S component [Bacillus andreraoultii]
MKKYEVKSFVAIGMLSGVAYVLMLLNFPLPVFPTWLKIDFSDIPALIAAMIMGPLAGVIVELLKNILDLLSTGSETGVPVGHIANFVTGICFILPTYYIYIKLKTKKGLTLALGAASVITAVVMSVLNYLVFLPMYGYFLDFHLKNEVIVRFIFPFNLLKGILLSIVFYGLFLKMQHWIQKQNTLFRRI